MLNRAEVIGRLGRDPEIRSMQNGDKIANLSIATTDTWKDKGTGERKERTEWHRVTVFGPSVGAFIEPYLRKGALVYVSGELQTRKWQDQAGQDRFTTEIVVRGPAHEIKNLSPKGEGGGGSPQHQAPSPVSKASDLDDEVPW